MGSFNNYMDQILPNFDPLHPQKEKKWTFYIIFTSDEFQLKSPNLTQAEQVCLNEADTHLRGLQQRYSGNEIKYFKPLRKPLVREPEPPIQDLRSIDRHLLVLAQREVGGWKAAWSTAARAEHEQEKHESSFRGRTPTVRFVQVEICTGAAQSVAHGGEGNDWMAAPGRAERPESDHRLAGKYGQCAR